MRVCLMSFACVVSFCKVRYLQSLHGVADVLAVVPVVFLALRPLQSVKVMIILYDTHIYIHI
jgi:hypothetical protein